VLQRRETLSRAAALASGALLLAAVACRAGGEGAGRKDGEAPPAAGSAPSAPSPAAVGYAVIDVKDGGRVSGRVVYQGKRSEPAPIVVTKDQEVCGATRKVAEVLVVGADGGLKNAVVSIGPVARGKAFPAGARPELDQHGCWFIPHVLVVPAEADIDIVNSDGILHNLHAFPKNNPPFNVAQPKFKKVLTQRFALPDVVRIACDVHPWMNGWIIVAADPYHVATGADGSFLLENVPPGTYTLSVWHETLGTREQAVTVAPGGSAEVTVTFGT